MNLLHPTVDPWRQTDARGIGLMLLVEASADPVLPDVFVRAEPDNEETLVRMHATGAGDVPAGWLGFAARLAWDGGNDPMVYCFKVVGPAGQCWLAADGPHPHVPPRDLQFRVGRRHQPPTWVADQVFYQIFPDRFCQGDPRHAVQTDEYVYGDGAQRVVRKAWGEPIDPAVPATAFYGGDLPGITARLGYLRDELGVTALYLTPVFTAGSNHRYDTEDYDNVDPHLGGNAALVDLRAALTQRGMRLVLDAVVNHTGANHPWLNRYGRHPVQGAAQSPASDWRGWYSWSSTGTVVGWKGHDSLPVLDFAAAGVREAVYAGASAILRRWLRPPYAADGWRLDVIHMLGEGPGAWNNALHVAAFRAAIKDENPQAYVLGEHFSEATRWLQGEQEDGAMNYWGFGLPVRAWLAGRDMSHHPIHLDVAQFDRWLAAARARVPWDQQLAQLNLLDSHDTARFFTLLDGDVGRMKLAVTLLMTYPGTPCVYYGDEIGLAGGPDPDCRRCFDWDRQHWNEALWTHYRAAIARRHFRAELRRGAYQTLLAEGSVFAFARYDATHLTVVVVNAGAAATVALPLAALPLPGIAGSVVAGDDPGWTWSAAADAGGWQVVLHEPGDKIAKSHDQAMDNGAAGMTQGVDQRRARLQVDLPSCASVVIHADRTGPRSGPRESGISMDAA